MIIECFRKNRVSSEKIYITSYDKKIYNKVLECGADKCRKLVWQFNYETHLKQNHSGLSEEAVMKLLGEHTDNFKTAAEAALVKRQNKKNRKRKRETDQKDPTFQPGMKLTVPFPFRVKKVNLQRSYYLQGKMA